MELPVYELRISEQIQDEAEVSFVALVDKPAIQRNFLAFKNEYKREQFKVVSSEDRIIAGPLMVPNMLIYRNNEQFGEHYVKFSSETIKDIFIKYAKKGYGKNVNLMHDPSQVAQGTTLFQTFISNEKYGIAPMKGYEDLPDGTAFGVMSVEDDNIWKEVVAGTYQGFSVEGVFDYEKPLSKEEQALRNFSAMLGKLISEL